jgi:hypothetical protein
MDIPQANASKQPECADKTGEHAGFAESYCASAIAEAESVLREISSVRRRGPYRTATQFGIFDLRLVKPYSIPFAWIRGWIS